MSTHFSMFTASENRWTDFAQLFHVPKVPLPTCLHANILFPTAGTNDMQNCRESVWRFLSLAWDVATRDWRSGISHIQPPPHFCILSYLGMGGRGLSSCAVWPKLTPWRLDGRQKMSNLEWLLTFGDNQMRSPLRDENPFLADAPILYDIIRTICIDLYAYPWNENQSLSSFAFSPWIFRCQRSFHTIWVSNRLLAHWAAWRASGRRAAMEII